MKHTFFLCLLLAALRLMSVASEEAVVPWQSVIVTSPELPVVGIVTINASTQGGAWQKLAVGAFGRTHTLAAAELKRLEGFPLSSLTLTHEAGYASLGGHTLHLKFSRTDYDATKKPTQKTIIISVPKDAALAISEPGPKFVPIAVWQNSPELNEKDGSRVFAILREHKIEGEAPGSAGITLSVREPQAAEARKLLAGAIVSEGLRIELIDDRGKVITPAEILGTKDAK